MVAEPLVKKIVHGVLVSDAAVRLGRQRVLGGTGDAGETADQVTVHDARADERVAVVDVLHDDLVARAEVVRVSAVARSLGLSELTGRVHRKGEIVQNLHIDVAPEIIAGEQRLCRGVIVLDRARDSFLTEIAERHEVLDLSVPPEMFMLA